MEDTQLSDYKGWTKNVKEWMCKEVSVMALTELEQCSPCLSLSFSPVLSLV